MRIPERTLLALATALAAGCRAEIDATLPVPEPVARAAIESDGAGWIRADAGALIAAGLSADASVDALRLSREGVTIAFEVERDQPLLGDAGAILFWAEPARSRWSDVAVYWLESGGAVPGERIGARSVSVIAPATAPLRARTERAEEKFYVLSLQNGPASNFVWDGAVATSGPASKTFAIDATRPLASGTFTLTLDAHGLSESAVSPDHHVIVEVNGHAALDTTFDGLGDATLVATGDAEWLVAGENTVTLRLPHDTGAVRDTVLVRSMTLDHPRHASVTEPDDAIVVEAAVTGSWLVDGFADGTEVYDLADPSRPVRLVNGTPNASAFAPPHDDENENEPTTPEAARLELRVDAAPARLLLAPPNSAGAPLAVRASREAGSMAPWTGEEMVIVTPDDLAPAAERLAEHRRGQGLDVRVLDWDAVVDGFGDGIPGPEAIRELVLGSGLSEEVPRWLLVFGDASHDPKEQLSDDPSGNRIPTFFDDAAGLMESPSDNALVAETSRATPRIAAGRIPAVTLDEADAVVDKLIAYDTARSAPETVLLAADDGVESWEIDLFESTSESLATLLASHDVERAYVSTLGAATARTKILDELAAGALYVNYLGHGNYTEWANEKLLTDADIASLPEHEVLPVFTVMNCLTGHFTQPNWKIRSLAEVLLVTPGRGAVAVIASSAMAYPGGQPELDLTLAQRVLADSTEPTLGEAFLDAKAQLDGDDFEQGVVLQSWHLLGDPSMRVRRPLR